MSVFSPLFFLGFEGFEVLAGLGAGSRSATMSVPSSFDVGQHLICCKSDYTEAEYLGKVTAVDGTSVSFQWASRSFKDTAAFDYIFVTPMSTWQAVTVPGTGGITPTYNAGIETLDTAGKELLHTRVKEERDYLEIIFKDALVSDLYSLKQWIRTELQGGLYTFGCAYHDDEVERSRCDVVKMRNPGAEIAASKSARVVRSWAVDLQIIERDQVLV